ncbi:MAG TPA: hypothetical protein VMZ50_01800 [Phycisphaerae bacterium]|nr:hypothetical protein [Phycisphaerae bacterium]
MKQFVITPAMGKRLIGKAMVRHPAIEATLKTGTLVIVAGTTNGYVAEEILKAVGQAEGFTRKGFRRGATVPPKTHLPQVEFPGDVVLVDGAWQKGKEVFDFIDDMKAGDVVVKGANAVDLCRRQAAVYIGHPMGGTIGASIPAIIGRRVKLIVPVGLEKRVADDVNDLAAALNDPQCEGPRLMPLPGEVFTELDAIGLLTGAEAILVAAGGVRGAEGCVWVAVTGAPEQIDAAGTLIESIASEPSCEP